VIVIGLTGGIGSGKSTVSDRFAERDAILIDADLIVRELQVPGQEVHADMVAHFGDIIVNADQSLDRQAIAKIVFNDKEALHELNRLVHPPVNREIRRRIRQKANTNNLLVLDIPLLVEGIIAGGPPRYIVSGIVVIDTPAETAVARLVAQRGFTEDDARARIAAQVPREKRLEVADFVIDNSVALERLDIQIDRANQWARALPSTEPTPEPDDR
jgi:dephospho-CoA kinase